MSEIVENFKKDLAEVNWKDLRVHLQRDALIIVAGELDLVEVAVAVAEDRSSQVEAWVAEGALTKPSSEQLSAWENALDKPFRMLIVQPFILIQAAAHA